jgi:hypothetical protein
MTHLSHWKRSVSSRRPIRARQPLSPRPSRWAPRLDGEPMELELRADYLVEAAGERLVAEVKTGDAAPRLDTAATRRQLLEYSIAFAVDGVLLVCPEAGAIHRVEFPGATRSTTAARAAG